MFMGAQCGKLSEYLVKKGGGSGHLIDQSHPKGTETKYDIYVCFMS